MFRLLRPAAQLASKGACAATIVSSAPSVQACAGFASLALAKVAAAAVSRSTIAGPVSIAGLLPRVPVAVAGPVASMEREFATLTVSSVRDLPGSRKQFKRLGRGRSSGLGKTAGRGQKGRGARSGLFSKPRFEGGQTMLWRRSPKRGFRNQPNRQPLTPLSIEKVVEWVSQGRIDSSKLITMKELRDSNCVGRFRYGVKLLHGTDNTIVHRLPVPLHLEVSHCSASVKAAVEANGGSVKFVYYSRLGLRHLLKPGSLNFVPGPSVPKPKKAARFELQSVGKAGHLEVKALLKSRVHRLIRKRK